MFDFGGYVVFKFKQKVKKTSVFLTSIFHALDSALQISEQPCQGSVIFSSQSAFEEVITKIAGIELPQGHWPELIKVLLLNMGSPQIESPAHLKQATLETLGYVCEEVAVDVLAQDQVNSILTAVVQGMSSSEGNSDVRYAAT